MAEQRDEMTVIGRGTTIKGEMAFEGGARVLGTFEGRIQAGGELQVASGATCRAELEAARIVVEGNVEGDITATDRLTLSAGAVVSGDIRAGTLVVTEGARFTGHVSVGPEALKAQAVPAGVVKRTAAVVVEPSPAAVPVRPWDAGYTREAEQAELVGVAGLNG